MDGWSETNIESRAAKRMLRRACRARGIDASTTDRYSVAEMRYRTDGIATLAVVTLHEVGAGRRGATAYGYGVAARAVEDEHNERAGAHAAVQSAMRCAATVIAHRCEERRLRADLDKKLEMIVLIGKLGSSMQGMLAESKKATVRS